MKADMVCSRNTSDLLLGVVDLLTMILPGSLFTVVLWRALAITQPQTLKEHHRHLAPIHASPGQCLRCGVIIIRFWITLRINRSY